MHVVLCAQQCQLHFLRRPYAQETFAQHLKEYTEQFQGALTTRAVHTVWAQRLSSRAFLWTEKSLLAQLVLPVLVRPVPRLLRFSCFLCSPFQDRQGNALRPKPLLPGCSTCWLPCSVHSPTHLSGASRAQSQSPQGKSLVLNVERLDYSKGLP